MLVEDARFVNGSRMLADERAGRANRAGANRQGKNLPRSGLLEHCDPSDPLNLSLAGFERWRVKT